MGARENLMAKLNVDNEQLNEIIKKKMAEKKCSATQALILLANEAAGKTTPMQEKVVPRGVDLVSQTTEQVGTVKNDSFGTETRTTTVTSSGFTKAKKCTTRHRIAITGTAGSGKTYSALMLATNFGGKVALADTEYHSASNYANIFDFDEMLIEPPYTVDKYVEAIDMAVDAGYSTLILDSISHMWDGEGGLLELKDRIVGRGDRNNYTAWDVLTPQYRRFVNHMLSSPIHMIHTIRSKTEYSMDKDQYGKTKITKVGLAPIQRPGLDYEYTVVFDMDTNHQAVVSKHRTNIKDFSATIPMKMDNVVAKKLQEWLEGGNK